MLRIHAGSVHPVTAPPIEDGAVLVDDRGTIAAVGPHSLVPTPPGARELAFPDASLVPGLVNTHTHLELTQDRKSTRLNSSHGYISYAVFCLKKKKTKRLKETRRVNSSQAK